MWYKKTRGTGHNMNEETGETKVNRGNKSERKLTDITSETYTILTIINMDLPQCHPFQPHASSGSAPRYTHYLHEPTSG